MTKITLALPLGSLILVTGANGYIASQVINELLRSGYRVRGTVRGEKPWLNQFFEETYGRNKFTTCILPGFHDVELIRHALHGVDGVLHLAGDISITENPQDVIPLSIRSTVNVLEAAYLQPSIRRVIIGSSSMAVYTSVPNREGVQITEHSWNDEAVQEAFDQSFPSNNALQWKKRLATYAACKTEAERAAWNWVREHRPLFELNVVVASFTVGEILHQEIGGSTMRWVKDLLEGKQEVIALVPPKWFVDVEDVARLYTIAVMDPSVRMERVFAFAEPHNWTEILQYLRWLRPDNQSLPKAPENEGRDYAEILPRKRAEELLFRWYEQRGWTPIQTSIARAIGPK
ncbi:putative NADPH-dependent methylglyoxal reductase (D-lactaldehyde dehydrogenase [Aspergillus clavatus NRRL 1]|uniref:NADPH-dependent methylglyoxal reductase (D-lactaldehyde dehydrogenase, putative) n=1 Tax=Aspergillus clavatus (strain ATCC 1007 / CBS 513.65 / DSM 816 / NCTC 3887 / NRRL 1 / QM 1276 / 107) TaxID=344612 RepID=A1C8B3_ASPCL|nr:NADPH-dependent methylglyoxal reductase (D-lactaldehyde dehydrogenase, putative [Aspergillus clavatus NRRL 1]EAW14634.1 NADPH-dependent methylglyoxal reductase (D-lactaldehyde dehydrogenase, putative [Aspergillus clavatus NRRL 1]